MTLNGHEAGVRLVPRMRTRWARQWPKKWRGYCVCGWRGEARLRFAVAWSDAHWHVDSTAVDELDSLRPADS